jgi:hypothetical protein
MPFLANILIGENMRPSNKSGVNWNFLIYKVIALIVAGIFVLVVGCKSGSEAIWSAESKSPDGQWIANARTIAQSGFGTGYIGTKVFLNWTHSS